VDLCWEDLGATLNAICSAVVGGHPPSGTALAVRALSNMVDPYHRFHPRAVPVACSWLELWRLADIKPSTIIRRPRYGRYSQLLTPGELHLASGGIVIREQKILQDPNSLPGTWAREWWHSVGNLSGNVCDPGEGRSNHTDRLMRLVAAIRRAPSADVLVRLNGLFTRELIEHNFRWQASKISVVGETLQLRIFRAGRPLLENELAIVAGERRNVVNRLAQGDEPGAWRAWVHHTSEVATRARSLAIPRELGL